jgi:hypothetical protein
MTENLDIFLHNKSPFSNFKESVRNPEVQGMFVFTVYVWLCCPVFWLFTWRPWTSLHGRWSLKPPAHSRTQSPSYARSTLRVRQWPPAMQASLEHVQLSFSFYDQGRAHRFPVWGVVFQNLGLFKIFAIPACQGPLPTNWAPLFYFFGGVTPPPPTHPQVARPCLRLCES